MRQAFKKATQQSQPKASIPKTFLIPTKRDYRLKFFDRSYKHTIKVLNSKHWHLMHLLVKIVKFFYP